MSLAVYAEALVSARDQLRLRSEDGLVLALPIGLWRGQVDEADQTVASRLGGPTLDIGCGPGRFVSCLAEQGLLVLGIDVAQAAVDLTRRRGGLALRTDVFGHVPGSGRWKHALLVDGNIGIGGDPARLLARTRELLAPDGRVMVELAALDGPRGTQQVRLETDSHIGRWFPWAWVTPDALDGIAHQADLCVSETWTCGGRSFAELAPAAARGSMRRSGSSQ